MMDSELVPWREVALLLGVEVREHMCGRRRASVGQDAMLERHGVGGVKWMDDAHQILDVVLRRDRAGLATPGQLRALSRFGPVDWAMTRAEAAARIDAAEGR